MALNDMKDRPMRVGGGAHGTVIPNKPGKLSEPGVTRLSPRMCETCGYMIDAVGTADGTPQAPGEGDVILCLNCGAPSEIRSSGEWVALTLERFALLDPEHRRDIIKNQIKRAALITTDLSRKPGRSGKA